MHSPLLALVWKECHEQKWKLASCCAVLVAPVLFVMSSVDRYNVDVPLVAAGAVGALIPIFIAMGLVSAERTRRTFGTLAALPARPVKILLTKVVIGALVCAIPVAAVIVLARFLPEDGGSIRALEDGTAWVFVWGAVYAFAWSLVAGIRQPTELRAGLMGIALLMAWVALAAAWDAPGGGPVWHWWINPTVCLALARGGESYGSVWSVMLMQLAVIGLLVLWAAWRITLPAAGRASITEGRRKASSGRCTLRRMQTTIGALAWKERRELRAVVLAGVVVLVMTPLSIPWLEQIPSHQDFFGTRSGVLWWRYVLVLVTTQISNAFTLIVPCVQIGGNVLAIMAAVGAACRDLTPRLTDFRRSRPITSTQWFWSKYLSGLTTVLLITMIPLALIGMMGDTGPYLSDARLSIMYFAPAFLLVYSVSFLLACLLRHTVYAGILSVGAMLAFYGSPYHQELWLPVHEATWTSPSDTVYVTFVVVMTLLATAATLLAWQAVRANWYWRRTA